MTRQDIANLTFKVVGLYCLIQALPMLGSILSVIAQTSSTRASLAPGMNMGLWALTMLAGPVLLGAMSIYLLTQSHRLAVRVFPDPEPQAPPEKILAIHALAYSVLGMYFIVNGLPTTLLNLIYLAAGCPHGHCTCARVRPRPTALLRLARVGPHLVPPPLRRHSRETGPVHQVRLRPERQHFRRLPGMRDGSKIV